jgi:hypothetical protein
LPHVAHSDATPTADDANARGGSAVVRESPKADPGETGTGLAGESSGDDSSKSSESESSGSSNDSSSDSGSSAGPEDGAGSDSE